MAETKKPDQSSSAAKEAAAAPKASLAPAAESGDPAVHQLLAELDIARSNGDEGGVKAAVDALAELGFKAS